MRTINFRAKRVDNGEVIYGDIARTEVGFLINGYEVIPESVSQLIALDKNGFEVYEGDTVLRILEMDEDTGDLVPVEKLPMAADFRDYGAILDGEIVFCKKLATKAVTNAKKTIKFRGRRAQDGVIVTGDLITWYKPGDIVEFQIRVSEGINYNYHDIEKDSIAQLVGYDKEGNELYEGDVVVDQNGKEFQAEIWKMASNDSEANSIHMPLQNFGYSFNWLKKKVNCHGT